MSNMLYTLDDEINPSINSIIKHLTSRTKKAAKKGKKWIKGAVESGTFRDYMRQRFGEKAFTKRGTLKAEYIDRVLADPNVSETTRRRAQLAKTLRRF